MILADKIMTQRKKNGWSQEELAEKMKVSRQSVSKWEGAQSVPDLEKILRLSRLFGVSTDYLLKDEVEEEGDSGIIDRLEPTLKVSMEAANEYLHIKAYTAKRIAFAVYLCILSPICLILLGAASEVSDFKISENFAGGVGLSIMFLMVILAVSLFIFSGSKTEPYKYFENEIFEVEYGVEGMVKERQKQYHATYTTYNIVGTGLCIFSIIPILVSASVLTNDFIICIAICAGLAIAGIGVMLFIIGGINWESTQKILQEGDYSRSLKKKEPVLGAVSTVYWLVVVAGYLGYSFVTNDWRNSWIVWPVAGVLYVAVAVIASIIIKSGEKS